VSLRTFSNKKACSSQGGFTLIETLVSLSLLAIISLMSYQAIEVVIGADERSRNDQSSGMQIQRAWQIIHRDLLHLRNRPFKDGLGGQQLPYETDSSQFGVRFTRGGGPMVATNPSGIRRISYSLTDEGQFIRQSWGITESLRYSEGVSLVLLEDVAEVLFEHLDALNGYTPDWPPPKQPNSSPLPKMVKVTIRLKNNIETSRLFLGVNS
jgi:general secretion pathway protein J